jgi:hypothetical protein
VDALVKKHDIILVVLRSICGQDNLHVVELCLDLALKASDFDKQNIPSLDDQFSLLPELVYGLLPLALTT